MQKYFLRGRIVLLLLLLFHTQLQLQADQWQSPSWHTILDSSDLVALVEATRFGVFNTTVKPLKIYHGELNVDEIDIFNFSNRAGPLDTMRCGERYLLFLRDVRNLSQSEISTGEYLGNSPLIVKKHAAQPNSRLFMLWTPTVGDHLVEGDSIGYDLLGRGWSRHDKMRSWPEFEGFLKYIYNHSEAKSFPHSIIQKLHKVSKDHERDMLAQYLMMFHFAQEKYFIPIHKLTSSKVILEMLSDTNIYVQAAAVRALEFEDPEFLGPLLLKHVFTADREPHFHYWKSIKDINRQLGGQAQMVMTLGKIKYKPAFGHLWALYVQDYSAFSLLVFNSLVQLDTPLLQESIERTFLHGECYRVEEMSKHIVQHQLRFAVPALMHYIRAHDREQCFGSYSLISTFDGLGAFDDAEVVQFLLDDFAYFLQYRHNLDNWTATHWTKAYIHAFTRLAPETAKPLVYDGLFMESGLNIHFRNHPQLISHKIAIEDSLNAMFNQDINNLGILNAESIVFIHNAAQVAHGAKPEYDYQVTINTAPFFRSQGNQKVGAELVKSRLANLRNAIQEQYDITPDQLIVTMEDADTDSRRWITFDESFDEFLSFINQNPAPKDLMFLKALFSAGFAKTNEQLKFLTETIENVFATLKSSSD